MSGAQVTITLGRSGQKVVKRPWPNSDGLRDDALKLSGSKRSLAESNAEISSLYTNKRLRQDGVARSSGYSDPVDTRIGGNDLRLKLLRKRMFSRVQQEILERKKIELRDKISRTIPSSEGAKRSLLRNITSTRGAGQSLRMESLRSSYSSPSMTGLRPKSPDGIPRISGGMSSSRYIDEVLQLPSTRPIDASWAGYMMRSDLLDPSRTKDPAPITVATASTRTGLEACKPLKEFPPASSTMMRSTYPDEPPTVTSLLHSLGLGKYSIHFQAEEVDMAALKQMGDRDLKELGIPMGPRKKILLAMLARSKRPIA